MQIPFPIFVDKHPKLSSRNEKSIIGKIVWIRIRIKRMSMYVFKKKVDVEANDALFALNLR